MTSTDPATGLPLPPDALQRVLFIVHPVHVYAVPPLASTKGYSASSWTADPARHIFTARCRIIETSYEQDDREVLKADVVLEDPKTGELFAAAPYTDESAVEPVVDSSRFFALSVRDPSGRKAVLGIGFEDRSEAFDFGVALQELKKSVLGSTAASSLGGANAAAAEKKKKPTEMRDLSLKEGETITINFGGSKFQRKQRPKEETSTPSAGGDLSAFSLPPPPGAPTGSSNAGNVFLPPPPPPSGSRTSRAQKRLSAQQLGFDDGQFGEFA